MKRLEMRMEWMRGKGMRLIDDMSILDLVENPYPTVFHKA